MNELLVYLIKVMSIHGLLFCLYKLIFSQSKWHSVNRFYLSTTLLFGFIIPLIELPNFGRNSEIIPEIPFVTFEESSVNLSNLELIPLSGSEDYFFSLSYLLFGVYILISLIFISKSIYHLIGLFQLKKKLKPVKKSWFSLYKISQSHPFSFFENVFIPEALFGQKAFDQVLEHECVHVQQRHSVDRLLMDLVVSLFWFNPFIYWYRSALIEIHEYQADELVIKKYDPIDYQEILFSQLQSARCNDLVSHFNFKIIKKRIVMMNSKQKKSGWIYLLTFPVVLSVVFAFSSKEMMSPIENFGKDIVGFIGPVGEKKLDESWRIKDDIPSILPFKEGIKTELRSGFGMRTSPYDKKKKHHRGVDFSCKEGTEVIATADGKVSSVQQSEKGFGNMVSIDHGNGFVTRYAHLSDMYVIEGAIVSKGHVIALSGNTGLSTGPHLHYEVIKDGEPVDPMDYIKNYKVKVSQIKNEKEVKNQLLALAEVEEIIEETIVNSKPTIRGEDANKVVEVWLKNDQTIIAEEVTTTDNVIVMEDEDKLIRITNKARVESKKPSI